MSESDLSRYLRIVGKREPSKEKGNIFRVPGGERGCVS